MAVMIQIICHYQYTSFSYVTQIAQQNDCDGNCAHEYSQHDPTHSQFGNIPLRCAVNKRKNLRRLVIATCEITLQLRADACVNVDFMLN